MEKKFTEREYLALRNELFTQAEEKYRDFVLTGIFTERALLGVRVPKMREIASAIVDMDGFLMTARKFEDSASFEEIMIRGFVVARREECDKEFYDFLKLIDNWEICDCFVGSMKWVKEKREEVLPVIDKLFDGTEFETRTALVLMNDFYVEPGYLSVVLDRIISVFGREEHYVKMGAAWTLATCFTKFPDETFSFLKSAEIPREIMRLTVAKIRSSYRIDNEWKERISEI